MSGLFCVACGAASAQPAPPQSVTPRAGPGYTNGWSLMTPEERHENRVAMTSMTSNGECRAYVEQHHRAMVERAKESNAQLPPSPRYDVCDGLP